MCTFFARQSSAPRALFVAAILALAFFAALPRAVAENPQPRTETRQKGWHFVKVRTIRPEKEGTYTLREGDEGSLTITSRNEPIEKGNKNVAYKKYHISWKRPPTFLPPGEVVSFDVSRKLLEVHGWLPTFPPMSVSWNDAYGAGTPHPFHTTADKEATEIRWERTAREGLVTGVWSTIVFSPGDGYRFEYVYEWVGDPPPAIPAAAPLPPASGPGWYFSRMEHRTSPQDYKITGHFDSYYKRYFYGEGEERDFIITMGHLPEAKRKEFFHSRMTWDRPPAFIPAETPIQTWGAGILIESNADTNWGILPIWGAYLPFSPEQLDGELPKSFPPGRFDTLARYDKVVQSEPVENILSDRILEVPLRQTYQTYGRKFRKGNEIGEQMAIIACTYSTNHQWYYIYEWRDTPPPVAEQSPSPAETQSDKPDSSPTIISGAAAATQQSTATPAPTGNQGWHLIDTLYLKSPRDFDVVGKRPWGNSYQVKRATGGEGNLTVGWAYHDVKTDKEGDARFKCTITWDRPPAFIPANTPFTADVHVALDEIVNIQLAYLPEWKWMGPITLEDVRNAKPGEKGRLNENGAAGKILKQEGGFQEQGRRDTSGYRQYELKLPKGNNSNFRYAAVYVQSFYADYRYFYIYEWRDTPPPVTSTPTPEPTVTAKPIQPQPVGGGSIRPKPPIEAADSPYERPKPEPVATATHPVDPGTGTVPVAPISPTTPIGAGVGPVATTPTASTPVTAPETSTTTEPQPSAKDDGAWVYLNTVVMPHPKGFSGGDKFEWLNPSQLLFPRKDYRLLTVGDGGVPAGEWALRIGERLPPFGVGENESWQTMRTIDHSPGFPSNSRTQIFTGPQGEPEKYLYLRLTGYGGAFRIYYVYYWTGYDGNVADLLGGVDRISIGQLVHRDKDGGLKSDSSGGSSKGDQVGNSNWRVEVPPDAIPGGGTVEYDLVPEAERSRYEVAGYTQYEPPLKITVSGKENVRLEEPALIMVKLPENVLRSKDLAELYFGYYTGRGWESYFPKKVDFSAGMAEIPVGHFSVWGWFKPSEEERFDAIAESLAQRDLERLDRLNDLKRAWEPDLDRTFARMGVSSKVDRQQLVVNFISYFDGTEAGVVDTIANLAYQGYVSGDPQPHRLIAMKDKVTESLTKFLAAEVGEAVQREIIERGWKEGVKELSEEAAAEARDTGVAVFGQLFNAAGNLSTALGAYVEGDSEGAGAALGEFVLGTVPLGGILMSSIRITAIEAQNLVDWLDRREIDKAYKVYRDGGENMYGYGGDISAGDFDTVMTMMGGPQRTFDKRLRAYYMKRWGAENEALINARFDRLRADAYKDLQAYFNRRITNEPKLQRLKAENLEFVKKLKAEGFLSAYIYQGFFNDSAEFSMEKRIAGIMKVRDLVLSLVSRSARASMNHDALIMLMNQYCHWSERGDLTGFYEYLEKAGYVPATGRIGTETNPPVAPPGGIAGRFYPEENKEAKQYLDYIFTGASVRQVGQLTNRLIFEGTYKPGATLVATGSGRLTKWRGVDNKNREVEGEVWATIRGRKLNERHLTHRITGDGALLPTARVSYATRSGDGNIEVVIGMKSQWIHDRFTRDGSAEVTIRLSEEVVEEKKGTQQPIETGTSTASGKKEYFIIEGLMDPGREEIGYEAWEVEEMRKQGKNPKVIDSYWR